MGLGIDDDLNFYAYAGNDLLNPTDPTGECPWCIGTVFGAAAGVVSVGKQVFVDERTLAEALTSRESTGKACAAGLQPPGVTSESVCGAVRVYDVPASCFRQMRESYFRAFSCGAAAAAVTIEMP
jgi:hypothetical protein